MRSSTLRQCIIISLICAAVICCHRAVADGGISNPYSDQDVTGGVVIQIEHNNELRVRERTGKERRFILIDGQGPLDTTIRVNDRPVSFPAIKVGMRVQIAYYYSTYAVRADGTASAPLPMKRLTAISNRLKE